MSKRTSPRATAGKAVAATLLATAAFQGLSYAQLLKIGVSFIGRNNAQLLGVDELAGVDPQRDWNNLGNNLAGEPTGNYEFAGGGVPPVVTSSNLFSEDGNLGIRGTSGITMTAAANDSWSTDGAVGPTPNDKLMKGIIKHQNLDANNATTIQLNNLNPALTYNLILYTSENNGPAGGSLALQGLTAYSTYFVSEPNGFDGIFTLGDSTNAAAPSANTDYVRWDGVAPTASGQLTMRITHLSGSDGFGITGFQLLQLAPPAGDDVYWILGAGTGTWDGASLNWRTTNDEGPGNETVFIENQKANFTNLGTAGSRTVNVDVAGVNFGQLNVNNTALNPYTFTGGTMGGLGGILNKDGDGMLTIQNSNTFRGNVNIKHGTVNVTTIGDTATPGNLGQGAAITLGDTTGANNAKLIYGGVTSSWNRTLSLAGTIGGSVDIPTGVTLTFTGNLDGTGTLAKTGTGALAITGTGGNFTGGITLSGGSLSVSKLGVGASKTINISNGSVLNYNGGTLNDVRNFVAGAGGGGTINVSGDAITRFKVGLTVISTGSSLTIGGTGRFAVGGVANFSLGYPTIGPNATLALMNEAGTNNLPANINIPQGTLEVAPGSFGASTIFNLSGGTLRFGHEGLQGLYWAGAPNQNDFAGTYGMVTQAFTNFGNPTLMARTSTNGQTDLNFLQQPLNGAPFTTQGFTNADNIRAAFVGKILITAAGDTTFFTSSDDGTVLFIDGVRVVNNNFFQGVTERNGTINLTAGLHDIAIGYFEGNGDAGMSVSYTPFGGTKQFIPNSALFAGDLTGLSASASGVVVSQNSKLEIASSFANMGTLDIAGTKTLEIDGSANFTATTLSGSGDYTIVTKAALSSVNMGTINGSSKIINKAGPGALVFSAASPTNLTVNNNAGLVVIQALNDGINPQNDPLAGSTVNYNGGGLGFSAANNTVAPLIYTNTIATGSNSYRIEAGSFGSTVTTANITWAPIGNVPVALGATATYNVRTPNYTLNVSPGVTGQGSLVAEEGNINFTSNDGIANTGGVTVRAANVVVSNALNTGPINLTGVHAGIADLNPTLSVSSSVGATSVDITRGTFTVGGTLTNTGAFSQVDGTTSISGTATNLSVSVMGGSFNANSNLNVTNGFTVSGGAATVNGLTSAATIAVNGAGTLTVRDGVTALSGTSVTDGRSLNLDMGLGNTRNFNSGINVQGQGVLHAVSGTTDFGNNTIAVQGRTFQSGLIESMVETAANADVAFVLGQGRVGQPTTGGVQNGFRLGNDATNTQGANTGTAWSDNDMWVYTGQFFDDDGKFSFAENVDDQTRVRIDGVLVLSSDQWDRASNTNSSLNNIGPGAPTPNFGGDYGMGPEGNGWHNIEVRFMNGGGGGGPSGNNTLDGAVNWSTAKGFVFSSTGDTTIDANNFVILTDPGDASVLRTVNGGGFLTIEAGATIAAGAVTGAQAVQLNGQGAPAVLQLNNHGAATASSADNIIVSGFSGSQGNLLIGDNNSFNIGKLTVPDGDILVLDKAAAAATGGVVRITGTVPGTSGTVSSSIGDGAVNVLAGALIINAPVTGTGTITASLTGTVGGTGTIAGTLTAAAGGTIQPGDSGIGVLTAGNFDISAGKLQVEISDVSTYDRLVVSPAGSLTLGGTLAATFPAFGLQVNEVVYLIDNQGASPVLGTFNGIADQGTINFGAFSFQISYDAVFGGDFNTGGNDVALKLLVVPEPTSGAALLGGLSLLAGIARFRRRSA